MRCTPCFLAAIVLMLAASHGCGQDLPFAGEVRIRVEPIQEYEKGTWITLPDYQELGSPVLSPDAEWVAFDSYKSGYNHSPAEIWLARRDGTKLKKLTNGATPLLHFTLSRNRARNRRSGQRPSLNLDSRQTRPPVDRWDSASGSPPFGNAGRNWLQTTAIPRIGIGNLESIANRCKQC